MGSTCKKIRTEDENRDEARDIIGLNSNNKVNAGVGQQTTFKLLGFKCAGERYKPDGWFLPSDKGRPAIVLEVKGESVNIERDGLKQIQKYIEVVRTQYKHVIGIVYNGASVRVFKNEKEVTDDVSGKLEPASYYQALFTNSRIDKEKIYELTERINNVLHYQFGMKNLQDRMIFTACALAAQRFEPKPGLMNMRKEDFTVLHTK